MYKLIINYLPVIVLNPTKFRPAQFELGKHFMKK